MLRARAASVRPKRSESSKLRPLLHRMKKAMLTAMASATPAWLRSEVMRPVCEAEPKRITRMPREMT